MEPLWGLNTEPEDGGSTAAWGASRERRGGGAFGRELDSGTRFRSGSAAADLGPDLGVKEGVRLEGALPAGRSTVSPPTEDGGGEAALPGAGDAAGGSSPLRGGSGEEEEKGASMVKLRAGRVRVRGDETGFSKTSSSSLLR